MIPRTLTGVTTVTLIAWMFSGGCGSRTDEPAPTIPHAVPTQPIPVQLVSSKTGAWTLMRQGVPYRIRGAGGDGSLQMLAEHGGNSTRLWGVHGDTARRLDEAYHHGVTVAVGIWLEHSQKGFDHRDPAQLAQEFDTVIEVVERYKDHPAVLVWGLGNEMEGYEQGDNPDVWKHVEALARRIKEIDPHHPVMSVVAEITDKKVAAIHELCPSLDIIGINSYGGVATLAERYRRAGGKKPYVVTEFGPVGTWEVPKNNIGAILEPTSNQKGEMYRTAYRQTLADIDLCLGSYAFLWGNKQEGTATWFGMLLPNGFKTNTVDVMCQEWTGQAPANRCPEIQEIRIVGSNDVAPETAVEVDLQANDPEGDKLNARWTLMKEADRYVTGGDYQEEPPSFDDQIVKSDSRGCTVRLPSVPGIYRLYVEIDDGREAVATANVPIRVNDPDSANTPATRQAP